MTKSFSARRINYVVFTIILLLFGCSSSDNEAAPSISSFTAADSSISAGGGTSLEVIFTGGTGIISNNVGAATSGFSVAVSPTITTTYVLTVSNFSGLSTSQEVTVTVIPAPFIASFGVGDSLITLGESVSLTGVFSNGTGSIDNSVGEVISGVGATVEPVATTTYNLTVTNATGNSVTSDVTITVTQPQVFSHLKQLTLPKNINVIEGQTLKVYFDNIVLVDDVSDYIFKVRVDGKDSVVSFDDHWEYLATSENLGEHKFEVIVNDLNGINVDYGISNIRVNSIPVSKNSSINVLVIGDSLTSNGNYVQYFGNKIVDAGVNDLNFIGSVSRFGYNYEGYGGNKWKTYYEAISTKSPFVYLETGLDFSRYFDEKTNGNRPEYVIIMLGINDIINVDGSDPQNIIERATDVFQTAELFIGEMKSVLPTAKIIVATAAVPNISPEAFVDDYGSKYTRENYRKVQHSFIMMQQDHFSYREKENIYLLPTYFGLDSLNGYPVDNALHPNLFGYSQIANMLFNEFMYIYSLN